MTKRKLIKRNCIRCDKEFETRMSEIKRGYGKFCGRTCSSRHRAANVVPKEPNCECAECGVRFHKPPSRLKNSRSGFFFCSKKCKDIAARVDGGKKPWHPAHYLSESKWNYRTVGIRIHGAKCNKCGYDKHPKILEVHHKDRDRTNNKVENLEVLCPNCHMEEHLLNEDGKWRKGS